MVMVRIPLALARGPVVAAVIWSSVTVCTLVMFASRYRAWATSHRADLGEGQVGQVEVGGHADPFGPLVPFTGLPVVPALKQVDRRTACGERRRGGAVELQ